MRLLDDIAVFYFEEKCPNVNGKPFEKCPNVNGKPFERVLG